MATAYFEALSRHALERAVENEEKLRIIVILANKTSVISSIVSDVLPAEPVCSVRNENFVLLKLEINICID